MTALAAGFRFSTAGLSAPDAVGLWREVFGRHVVKVEMEPLDHAGFYCDAQIEAFPEATLVSVRSAPNLVRRTPALVADGGDDLIIGILAQGQASATQGNREVSFSQGQAVLWANDLAGSTFYPSNLEYLAVAVPRRVLTPSVADPNSLMMTVLNAETGALKLLSGYAATLLREAPTLSSQMRALAAAHMHDLVALALGATRDATEIALGRGARVARLRAIRADIDANIANRDLSLAFLAKRHGISERYVRSLLDGADTSFTDLVLSRRLARAHRMLTDPRYADRKISAIAFDAGFGDLSYFNNAFRRRYGGTPSDIRAATRDK